ncbi:hypothetical protein AQUSIP_02370 [Aquicella siphonis]|uniref:Uncharacterized protein n=1 Tax=Aquicella siphonis TaxID=254247 RepID=A0A5E4PEW0_9COXI|nr:hypothetical protein [Aquicella siphonis]VVC74963.1 hypothetical protein AQUSIP_02370 [Aquicella siphonis]
MMRVNPISKAVRLNSRLYGTRSRTSTHALLYARLNQSSLAGQDIGTVSRRKAENRAPEAQSAMRQLSHGSDAAARPHRQAKRQKFSYLENHTAALSLDTSMEELEVKKQAPELLLLESKDRILYHAAARVDYFFYTLVAYYGTHYTPGMGHTFLQFGRGRNSPLGTNITQACHSSFFGAFVDNSPKQVFEKPGDPHSILTGTHFLHSLNATVELPAFVNQLDDELENTCECRTKGLEIIREVSMGKLNPVEGLNKFFKMMEDAFSDIKNHKTVSRKRVPYLLRDTTESPAVIKNRLIDIVMRGTFGNKWNAQSREVECEYIEMLLRLNREEKMRCRKDEAFRMKCYQRKMAELQQEIRHPEENEHSCGLS